MSMSLKKSRSKLKSPSKPQITSTTESIPPDEVKRANPNIVVQFGDITTLQVDAIVISSSSQMLRERVLQKLGDEIRTDYNLAMKEETDIAIPTNAKFPMKTIFFLPLANSLDETQWKTNLENFVSTAMENAFVRNYHTVAFPAIGCGMFGCPVKIVAETLVKTAHEHGNKRKISVIFVIEPTRTDVYEEFQNQVALINPPLNNLFVTIENSNIEIINGDLTTENVDVIVAGSASEILLQTIFQAAGDEATQTFRQVSSANPEAPLLLIPAGKLPCNIIFIHKWKPNEDEDLLRDSIINFIGFVIQHVIAYDYKSVGIPAIGCGKLAYSLDIIVKTMIEETKIQLRRRKSSLKVKFIVEPRRKDLYDAFCAYLHTSDEYFPRPSTWEPMRNEQIRFVVPQGSTEYSNILSEFDKTMTRIYTEIVRIERIQNERWYKQYRAHSEEFLKRLQKDTEMRLYHGCDETAAISIINHCFNRSFAGKNGTLYGFGVYFSPQASYSHTYTCPNVTNERCMFYSRVLIGNMAMGNSSMRTCPVGFDSTGNGNNIYVTYHDAQAYADYLIVYK